MLLLNVRKNVTSLTPYYSFGGYISSHDCDTTPCWQKHCQGCLLDGRFAINIMKEEFSKRLGLPIPKPTPCTLRMIKPSPNWQTSLKTFKSKFMRFLIFPHLW